MTSITRETVLRLARKALERGAERPGLITVEWDVSGDCQSPKSREYFARAGRPRPIFRHDIQRMVGRKWIAPGGGDKASVCVIVHARCRLCRNCLRYRARGWQKRAVTECRASARTWFGTLTLSPQHMAKAWAVAQGIAAKRGYDLDGCTEREQFAALHAVVSRWLTLYLKRVREQSSSVFKYLLVAEAGKESSRLHYHILIHEQTPALPVSKKILDGQWPYGFTKFRLIQGIALAYYISKYLSKDALARVRASVAYGTPPQEIGAQAP